MSITVQCPKGHFIAEVDVTDDGVTIHHPDRCGLVWLYAPKQKITRIHARCSLSRCSYDGSMPDKVLRAKLGAAIARGDTEYRLTD